MKGGGVYLLGAAAVLSAIGLVAVITSRRPAAGDGEPQPSPVPPEDPETRTRQAVITAALGELGEVGGDRYWADVQPDLVGSGQDWCGGFALAMLHRAGLALDEQWTIGKGFILVGPHKLTTTQKPKPGDLIYIDQPFQHQGIVRFVDGDRIHTIDGNTHNVVTEHDRPRSSITAFFSLEPLLKSAGLIA